MLKHKYISTIIVGSIALVIALHFIQDFSLWLLIPLLLLWLGLTSWGSFDIRLKYFLKAYSKSTTEVKQLSITFDDGPHEFTQDVLTLLGKYNAKATFFCIGTQIEKHPEILKQIIAEGHVLGNHTYSHANSIGFAKTEEVIDEIRKNDVLIKSTIDKTPKLFRPPFGVTNPRIAKAVNHTKHNVIGWNVRSLDTVLKNHESIFNRIKPKVKPGCIILFHDTSKESVLALEQLLVFLDKNQYTSITVDQLLNLKAYE